MTFSIQRAAAGLLLTAATGAAAQSQLWFASGRDFDSQDTNVARLAYRLPVSAEGRPWWWPQQIQLGASAWWVGNNGGTTRRLDVSATPVWRTDLRYGYVEAGLGIYLLSNTINSGTHRLPSSLQFGTHLGTGIRLGERATLGIALQHLSNAGIKQPNGGINFYLLTASYAL